MAAADKLWFELGVRDEISSVLEKLMRNSENLANALSDDTAELKNVYKNIVDISNVYDKIYVAQKRISALKGTSITADQKKGLKDMSKELDEVRKQFTAMFKSPDRLLNKGEAQFDKMRLNVELMVKDVLRYVDNIEAKERAEATNAANESKRIDDLKAKYYELQRYRKQLSDAIVAAAPGTDLTDATSVINSITGRMSAVSRAQKSGRGLPGSTTGADYDEFLRKVKAELDGLSSATNDYNARLEQNRQIQSSLNKLKDDTVSQQTIAGIRKQTSEYTALGRKIQEITTLLANVQAEQAGLAGGTIKTPTYTKDKVTDELNAIQRRYNEALAAGRQREVEDAEAKNQKSAATRKAMEAVGALAHVNDSLISSYNRVAEAGSQANRISIQLQNQIGAYAGLYGIERILRSVITIGGQFEFQHIALQNILGDLEQANTLFIQLQDLAVESPKTFMELTGYVKQLSAYQIPYDELFDTTKRLADISTGLGVDMSRLILAYGQVRSAAVLRGQELRQFTEAGIPLVQKLAEKFSELNGRMVTTGEVFDLISKRAVPFKMVQEIMWDMTNEGGQFYDMQSKLADTLYGKYQKLQDSWQIMLGRIADGENIMGKGLKVLLETIVSIVSAVDTLMPVLGLGAAGKFISSATTAINNRIDRGNGTLAIKNMEAAKEKEIARLERERIYNHKVLNAAESQLVLSKGKLTANELSLLLLEDKITERQMIQLANAGKLNQLEAMRTLRARGYTIEQLKQIRNGNIQMLQGGESTVSKLSKSAFGLIGGWWGAAFAAIGGVMSLYERAGQQAERAGELADSATSSILSNLSNVNNLYNTLTKDRPDTTEEMATAVERMTNALKNSGNYSEEIEKQVAGTDNLTEKYRILFGELEKVSNEYLTMRDNVKAYIEAANKSGDGNWFESLFNDNMSEDLLDWSKANIAKNIAKKSVDRLSAAMKLQLENFYKEIGAWNEKEMASLDWKSLYDRLSEYGRGNFKNFVNARRQTDFDDEVYDSIKNYQKALDELRDKEMEVDSQMQEYADHIEVALEETLRKQGLNPAAMVEWDNEALMKFRDSVNEVLNSYELDGETRERFREKLYSKLLNEHMIVKIKALPSIEEQDLAPWQEDLKNYFENNKLRIVVDAQSSLDKVEKDLQNKHAELQESLDRNGKILIKFGFDLSNLPQDIESGLAPLAPEWRNYVQKVLQDYNNDKAENAKVVQAGKDLGLNINKKTTSGSGSKKDTQLEALKNRIDLYKKFYQELEGYKNIYTESEALDVLKKDGEFGKVFEMKDSYGNALKDLTDYKQSLHQLTEGFKANTEARKKLIDSTNADIENKQRKEATENIKAYVSELQKMMSVMSENYKTYRKWLELTGDETLAARAAGVTQNTTYEDYLRDQMQKELNNRKFSDLTPDDVFGLSEKDVQKFGKESGIVAVWEDWRKHQQLLKKEQWDLYEEAIKNAKGYDDKIADVNRHLEEQVAALEAIGASNELIQSARTNAEDQISELQWEKFKKDNDWGRVFGDLDNMSLTTIKNMVDAMKKFQKETRLSEKETRAWQKAMKDLTSREITIDPVNSLTDAIKRYNDAVGAIKTAKQNKKEADDRVAQIQGEIVTNPQAAESKQKRLEVAIKKQTEANKKLIDAEDDASESFNDLKKAVSAIANSFNNLGSSLSSLGSSVGGDFGNILGGFGSMMSSIGKGISSINSLDLQAKGFTGVFNNVSAVLSVVTAMVDMNKALASILPSTDSLYEKHAAEQKEINQLREAVDSYRVALAKAQAEEKGWIGDNPLRKLQDAYQIHGKVVTEYYNKLYEAQEAYIDSAAGIKKALVPIIAAVTAIVAVVAGAFSFGAAGVGVGALGAAAIGAISAGAISIAATSVTAAAIGAAIAAGVGYAVGQAVQAGIDSISYGNGQTDARSNMKVQTRHKTFFRSEKTQNLEEWTKENLGLDLFDKSGLIDLKVAQAVLDSGVTLVGETKETLEKLMELREQYDEWEKSIKDYISNSFGGLADDMTNAIWDWLSGGKDALDSFRDYASDTFKQIAQDAVKSFLKVTVLDKFEEQLENLYKAYSMQDKDGNRVIDEQQLMLAVASVAGDMAIAFEQMIPVAESLGKTVADAFQYQGYDVVNGSKGSSSTSTAIKGMSESQADVLAGYINAIRADVSVNRTMIANYYPQFLSTMQRGNAIADSQLIQLRTIVDNTRQNREFVERIYNILHSVTPDGMRIQVK